MLKITVGVEGMSCGMCEAHVNDAVRAAFKVKKVTSSHKNNETVIITESEIDENTLRTAIEKSGYTVTSVTAEPYKRRGLFSR